MNIEKNKTFLLELPEIGSCYGVFITKNEKDYILISKDNKRLFKICLNAKNETESYEKRIGLNEKLKEAVFKITQAQVQYIDRPFNYDHFFVEIQQLKIPRSKMPYSLYLDGSNDYLTKYEWVAKTIQITSKFFTDELIVFIYREKNTLVYGIKADFEKVAKYVFKIENDVLNLIKEERYNDYQSLNFVEFKDDFRNLTTTSHEMQRDISSKDDNDIFAMTTYKKIFGLN